MQQGEAGRTIGVMLVDDHQTLLWGLSRLIDGDDQMQVVGTARTCEEALLQVRRLTPDIIVLDLDLAGRSALDILPELLSNLHSKALILTGDRQQKTVDMAVRRGARGVLRKDAPAQEVLKAIEMIHAGRLWLDGDTMSRLFTEITDCKKAVKPDPEAEKQATLTAKERKIIQAIVQANGTSNKALAERLCIAEHTLRNHVSSIYQKLDVANRLELYMYVLKHHLDRVLS